MRKEMMVRKSCKTVSSDNWMTSLHRIKHLFHYLVESIVEFRGGNGIEEVNSFFGLDSYLHSHWLKA